MRTRPRWSRAITRRLQVRQLPGSFRSGSRRLYRRGLTVLWQMRRRLSQRLGDDGQVADFLRRRLWHMNRSYFSTNTERVGLRGLDSLLAQIATGETVAQEKLLPYLCLEGKSERAEVNGLLADAFFQAQTEESIRQAREFMRRAWLLSGFAPDLLPLYVKIFAALQDIEGIREAYKRLGLAAGRRGDISGAIQYFDRWQMAYYSSANLDKYEYDFDILSCMDDLAALHRVPVPRKSAPANNERIRLAYLLRGVLEPNSNLIQISLEFAKHHDRSRFDVTFFTPEPADSINRSPQGREYLKMFASFGYQVNSGPYRSSRADTLLALAGTIREANPHILIASAALADFSQYFITTLRPAPIMMGLVQGPPPQFAPPALDWCIAWTKHPLMDCPVNCSWVEIKLDYPNQGSGQALSRESLQLPDDACVLMSAGRYPKFQSREFWQAMTELLSQHSLAYFVAVGVSDDEIPFLSSLLPPEVRPRVRCLGWRNDFLNILPTANILIDTYPNGGGQVIVQAMAMGIPLVAHRNDYMRRFDQTEWSPVEDFIRDPEIVVPRGDFAQFKQVVSRLIADKEYREEIGERCRAEHVRNADPSRAIRGCEAVYTKVLQLLSAPTEQA
jgi:Glycosyl transferases group 1